ncbi:MAG: RNA methyltransferase [Pseudomonadota bacterium]
MARGLRGDAMRGYFAIGVEGLSKPGNLGNLMRTAYAFGAQFFFTINAELPVKRFGTDTAKSINNVPYFSWDRLDDMQFPAGCTLVGVELTDEAIDLPSFRHPSRAAYVLGPERESLSPAMVARCDHVVKIPTRFCVNVATAGAIVMYDRAMTSGKFADRPVRAGGPTEGRPDHVHGGVRFRTGKTIHQLDE